MPKGITHIDVGTELQQTEYETTSPHESQGQSGSDNFGGYGSYTTITLSPAMADTDYRVLIRPTADPSAIGGVWISNKATNSFRVNNTGSGKSAFEWAVEPY